MYKTMPAQQRGLSLSGLLVGAVVLIFAILLGLKLIPAYMQNAQIQNTFAVIASDPELQKSSVRDIKMAFSKRADVDNITAIKADDIVIEKDGDALALSVSYSVMIPLVANISLYLDFNPSSAE